MPIETIQNTVVNTEPTKDLSNSLQQEDSIENTQNSVIPASNGLAVSESGGEIVSNLPSLPVKKPPHRFQKGVSGNPKGRPKGSLSIITNVKKVLKSNPALMKAIVLDLITEPKHRDFLVRMIDGNPRQSTELTGEVNLPFTFKVVREDPK